MKHFFSNLTMVAILVTTVIFTSCQKEEVTNPSETGKLSFGFNLKTQVLNKGMDGPELKTTSNINPVAVIANLVDENGKVVFNNKRIELQKQEGAYITKVQELKPGNYKLTDYYLVDKDSLIVGAASKKVEANSSALKTILPIEVAVSKGEVTTLVAEAISTKFEPVLENQLKSGSGYSAITFDFFYPFSENLSQLLIKLKQEAGKVYVFWGDGSVPSEVGLSNSPNLNIEGTYSAMIFGDVRNIQVFRAQFFNITNINFYGVYDLEDLRIYSKGIGIDQIDISNLSSLKKVGFEGNQLSSLDISNNPNIEELSVMQNNLSKIQMSNNLKLKDLNIYQNNFVNFNFDQCANLERFVCTENQIEELDVVELHNLSQLYCSNIDIDNLDVTNNSKLEILWVQDNEKLKSIDISKNPILKTLRVGSGITSLDISNNKILSTIQWTGELEPDDINNFYTQLYIHASTNGVFEGKLYAPTFRPTSPLAINLKNSLVNIYNWTINE